MLDLKMTKTNFTAKCSKFKDYKASDYLLLPQPANAANIGKGSFGTVRL